MRIDTDSPEMEDVPGAVAAQVLVAKVPCGVCYSTTFVNAEGKPIRQDQYVVVDKSFLSVGVASPVLHA